jgi:CubicO group peptidase (beta-lactamase class C family)
VRRVDIAALDRSLADPRFRHVTSVLVAVDGELVAERYFRDRGADDLANVHSVTKSFVSTVVGIAIADGLVDLAEAEPFLTMTSGYSADGEWDIDEIADRGESWSEGPLRAPRTSVVAFSYNNGAVHALAARIPMRELAEERLFAPLGVTSYRWPEDPDGNVLGYGHLEVRPRDMLALGQLYLDGGRGVVPREYVERAATAHTAGGPPENVGYGYLWWVGEDRFFAGGYGGQYIVCYPRTRTVFVSTADVDILTPSSRNPLGLAKQVAESIG